MVTAVERHWMQHWKTEEKMDARAEFEELQRALRSKRVKRKVDRGEAISREEKLRPCFKRGFESSASFYINPPRGYQWCAWIISDHVNQSGYHLMWRQGRKGKSYTLVRDKYMAGKNISALKRRARKYQDASYEKRK